MDLNNQEPSTSRHEEAIDLGSKDLIGVGRLYECVFCKRGFDLAQALGGHMNIHRSTRDHRVADKKPTSTNVNHKQHQDYHRDFVYLDDYVSQPTSSLPAACFPSSPRPDMNKSRCGVNFFSDKPGKSEGRDTGLDLGLGLGLDCDPTILSGKREVEKVSPCEKEEELDLELRLGL